MRGNIRIMTLTMVFALALTGCGDDKRSSASGGEGMTATTASESTGGALTEDDVKTTLTRRLKASATGVGSTHSATEVTYQSVEIAPARTPNAQDEVDGIHSDAIYPVRVQYTENRSWGTGGSTDTVETHYAYDFYRDEFGSWAYSGKGPIV